MAMVEVLLKEILKVKEIARAMVKERVQVTARIKVKVKVMEKSNGKVAQETNAEC